MQGSKSISPRKTDQGMCNACVGPPRNPANKSAPAVSHIEAAAWPAELGKGPQHLKSQVCFFSAWNYKVEAAIVPDLQSLKTLLSVLDTGAVHSIIGADLLTP